MAYKTKIKKQKQRDYNYEEVVALKKKYKGHPPFTEITREGDRIAFGIPKAIHKKGEVVNYKDELAIVRKVSKKGITIETFKHDKKSDLSYPSGKTKFITENKVQHQIYPAFIYDVIPVGVYSPYSIAREEEN